MSTGTSCASSTPPSEMIPNTHNSLEQNININYLKEDIYVRNLVDQYIEIRDHLFHNLYSLTELCFTEIWDPIIKYNLIQETNKLIDQQLKCFFPNFPCIYLPKVKFKVNDDEREIEAGIQMFLNTIPDLKFLGTNEMGDDIYDLYIRESWDSNFSHVFYAKYDHPDNAFLKGSKVAAAEYMIGKVTPLSVAYSYALDEGYIK